MTEPEKPGEGGPPPYSLPSWIDQAIAKSKGEEIPASPAKPPPADLEPEVDEEAETREFPAVTDAPPAPASLRAPEEADTREVIPSFIGSQEPPRVEYPSVPETPISEAERTATEAAQTRAAGAEPEVVVVEPEPARKSAMPWIIVALFMAAAALVMAYLIWLRPAPM